MQHKELLLYQLSQLQLTASRLKDGKEIGVELAVQKKLVVEQKKSIEVLKGKLAKHNAKCVKLEVDMAQMDRSWRMKRLSLKASESLTKKQRDEARNQLDEEMKKRKLMEKKSKNGRWIRAADVEVSKETKELKSKVAKSEEELINAKQLVNGSNSDNSMAELKNLLEAQQKLNKEKDDQINRLEEQVKVLRANNEDLMAKLNKEQFFDASRKDDNYVREIAAQDLEI